MIDKQTHYGRMLRGVVCRPLAAPAMCLVVLLPACVPTFPDAALDPEIVGVIEQVDTAPQADYVVTLADGTSLEINREASDFLVRTPEEGALYLGGGDPPWHAFLPREADCWVMASEAERDGKRLHFRNGIRLSLAEEVDFGWPGELDAYSDPRTQFCVNERGEVTSYRGPG